MKLLLDTFSNNLLMILSLSMLAIAGTVYIVEQKFCYRTRMTIASDLNPHPFLVAHYFKTKQGLD